ncbi:unnamed protein product, partial [Ectocarpus sp. 12 AP-2014]
STAHTTTHIHCGVRSRGNMTGQIVPKRFGLKYSPKPAIALEYQKPDSGIAIVEVQIEQLSPKTFDVSGVVDALQKKHPCHLGPDMVSVNQLERLVSRLLSEGRAHLPGEYPITPEQMVVNEPQYQPSSTTPQKHGHPTQPLLLPKSEDYDSDNSGRLSTGPTPAPTPEVPRVTRDLSEDGGIATSYAPLSAQGGSSDGIGSEEGKHDGGIAAVKQQVTSGELGGGDKQISAGTVGNTAAAAAATGSSVEEAKTGRAREDEEKRDEDGLCPRYGDDDQSRVERELNRDNDEGGVDAQVVSRVGASKEEEETITGETDTKLLEPRGDPEEGDCVINDYADHEREGQHRVSEDNVEGRLSPHTSEDSHVATTAAATATSLEEKNDQKSLLVEPGPGPSGSGREQNEAEDEEEDIPEIEEELVDGIEIEDFEEGAGGSNRVDIRDGEESGNGLINRTKSNSEDNERADDTGDTADPAVAAVASVGDIETAPERTETGDASGDAVVSTDAKNVAEDFDDDGDSVDDTPPGQNTRSASNKLLFKRQTEASAGRTTMPGYSENDHLIVEERRHGDQTSSSEDDVVSASKTTEREPGEMGAAKPPGAPPPPSLPLPSASNEGGSLSSLSSPLASPRGFAPLSSLAGLPPPPMGGARQRLGLLGALPPVGGKGLPSLVLPGGLKASSAPGQERKDVERKAGEGGEGESATGGTTEVGGLSSRTSTPPSPSSSGKYQSVSAAAISSTTKEGSASSVGSLAHAPAGEGDDDRDGENDGSHRFSTAGGVKEQEETKDDEEAALRARLGLGDDVGGGGGGGGNNSTLSPPGSPKQHQGQEEEDAGRALLEGLGGKIGGGTATNETPTVPVGGRDVGGYFGGSDEEISEAEIDGEVSSVGDDISFEQESVESGGDDDYFS